MILNFNDYIKENYTESKLAFDETIKSDLRALYVDNSIFRGIDIDKRVNQLISLHKAWLDIVRDKYSSEEIASKLYQYDLNLVK